MSPLVAELKLMLRLVTDTEAALVNKERVGELAVWALIPELAPLLLVQSEPNTERSKSSQSKPPLGGGAEVSLVTMTSSICHFMS